MALKLIRVTDWDWVLWAQMGEIATKCTKWLVEPVTGQRAGCSTFSRISRARWHKGSASR